MGKQSPLILLTNDDGYDSPGIIELAYHLYDVGDVLLVAPATHYSGAGRGIPFGETSGKFGMIDVRTLDLGDNKMIHTYAVHGTPALSVAHACLEIADRKPDICVSGINFGENVGRTLHYSGTIGAAIEAADMGIPTLALSLELDYEDIFYVKGDREIFTQASLIAKRLVDKLILREVQNEDEFVCLNVNVPRDATIDTEIQLAFQSSRNRWEWVKPDPRDFSEPYAIDYRSQSTPDWEEGSDCDVLLNKRNVAVTPLTWSIDEKDHHHLRSLEIYIKEVQQLYDV